jgi:hypothetical protein
METREDGQQSRRLKLAIVIAVALLLRLPFLNQAFQGDDVYYLEEAEHAQVEPLHPQHFQNVFLGNLVDMRGHSHPPMNAWILAGLQVALGDIREVPFHAAYIAFSLIAALAMWSLAQRFSSHPLWATLLFLAAPVFVVNGNSLETDLPFLAFWMASAALFVAERYALAVLALILASLTSFQAVFLTPILWLYCWLYQRKARAPWIVALAPVAAIAAWQTWERASTGSLPAAVLTGYFRQYGFQHLEAKLRSALGLSIHACWLVFPLLLPPAALLVWRARRYHKVIFLAGWIAIFLAGAFVVFFAGSARYLLPIAAPIALLVSELRPAWLATGFGIQMTLALLLATVNYQHWDAYRRFAKTLPTEDHRTWINGDWGLRFYLEGEGGLPLLRDQAVRPGDMIVTSELSYPLPFTTGGGTLAPLADTEIRPAIPLRLIGLEAHSGYSTVDKGWLPFSISTGPIDRVKAQLVVERKPTQQNLRMDQPEAQQQIVSGVYALEQGNAWRWAGARAVVLLKRPPQPERLRVDFTIHEMSQARKVTVLLDGVEVASQTCQGPGRYRLETAAKLSGDAVTIVVDKTFSVPGDSRMLGLILSDVGFVP